MPLFGKMMAMNMQSLLLRGKYSRIYTLNNKDPGGVNGNWHWVNSEGKPLWEVAEEFLAQDA